MIVTTGGRGVTSTADSSPLAPAAASISFEACSSNVITFVSAPKKRAISLASSAYSPSSGLLLRRAEHSAGRAGATELRDARQDELGPEAEVPDQHRVAALRPEPCAWDAWDGA